ncbi:MAG: amidohydrolase family protein [Gemmatales bacterium]|nr:amidohydrolase family protein [Gemmatales bacterium]MDW8175804.1 amidohydrolase family protein [Gemmatales bacterium]
MVELLIRAQRYDTGQPVEVYLQNGYIQAVRAAAESVQDRALVPTHKISAAEIRVLEAEYLAPGFCDIQVNGALGHNFTSSGLTVEAVRAVSNECLRHGTTRFCPTVITSDTQTLRQALRVLAQAVAEDPLLQEMIPGIHLEGPYISPEPGPRGAHPAEQVRPPNREEFRQLQESAQGLIRVVTLAPNWPEAPDFIAWLSNQGVLVALGHHNARPEQISAAVRAGARLCTHLGNGCDLFLPRHPNYLWEQLAQDALWASLICDGHHLPASVIKCFLRCKTPHRCVLISDASPLAGLSPGRYCLWGKTVTLHRDGRTEVVDERGQSLLAGAAAFLDTGVFRAWRDGDIALAPAVQLATCQPRQLLGLSASDFLQPGRRADLVLFDVAEDRLQVRYTLLGEHLISREAKSQPRTQELGPCG